MDNVVYSYTQTIAAIATVTMFNPYPAAAIIAYSQIITTTIGIVVKIAVDRDLVPQYPAPTRRIAMAIARFTLTVRYTYPTIAIIPARILQDLEENNPQTHTRPFGIPTRVLSGRINS